MKKYIILFFILIFSSIESVSSESIYDTKFYTIDINNEIILDAKNREINNIKLLSFYNILNKILTHQNIIKFNDLIIIEEKINYLIKNILIENEFISSTKYKADVKINFDYKEIVNLLRKYKIDYTDYFSPSYLIVVLENTELTIEGLSKNNSFYNLEKINNFNLIKLLYPELTPNDRFLLPYEKIIQKDKKSLKKISTKYNTNYIFLILNKIENDIFNFDINVFSTNKNNILNIGALKLDSDLDYQNKLLIFLNEWWKKNHYIDNSIMNKRSCLIKNSNIRELYYINSKINSISQVKSNILNQINLGLNMQDITFYGDLMPLTVKLLEDKIELLVTSDSQCIISIAN